MIKDGDSIENLRDAMNKNPAINKDMTGTIRGIAGQNFTQGEKVMVRRLGDGKEYRAKISGVAVDSDVKVMIIEIVDNLDHGHHYSYTHCAMPEVCIDKESWSDD